jgi:hypothetical protein
MAEGGREQRSVALGAVDVGLHFAQGDGSLSHAAIVMKDRILGVLPSLIGQSFLGLPMVFDEAVAVPIAVGVDPAQRGLGVGPQSLDGLEVSGTHEVLAQQQHEQWVASTLP